MATRSIEPGVVDVWRVPLQGSATDDDWAVLSADERERAGRFHFDRHRWGFVRSHAAVRRIMSEYVGKPPGAHVFTVGAAGKPSLAGPQQADRVEFNLSHSGDVALVAVAALPVGVDVEQWDRRVEFLELAEHYFSAYEREALRGVASEAEGLMQGFFNIWSRKEAYLKATGAGVAPGLHHFDVTMAAGGAALVSDRSDAEAHVRWAMAEVPVEAGYSAAVVTHAPLRLVQSLPYVG